MLQQRIQTFLEVANCLSFSTAARNLYISQQAVTKQIASLEQELGLRLFYRTTRQVTLTPAGSLLRDSFTQINRQIRSDIRKARELNSSGKSLLRVGFLSSLSRKDIILPITDFLMQHCPDTALDIRLLDFVVLRNSLLDDQLDFCVTTSNDWRFWPGIHTTVLQQKQFQVVYSARHPLAAQKQISPARPGHPYAADPAQRQYALRHRAVGEEDSILQGRGLPGYQHLDGTAGTGGGLCAADKGD